MSQHVRDMLDGAEYGFGCGASSMRWIPAEGDRWAANPRPPAHTPVTLVVDEVQDFAPVSGHASRRAWDLDAPPITREQLAAALDVPIAPLQPIVSPSFAERLEAAWPIFQANLTQFFEAAAETIRSLQELAGRIGYDFAPPVEDVRAHALWAAQHRNTGPSTVPAAQARRPRRHAHEPVDRPPPRRARARRRA